MLICDMKNTQFACAPVIPDPAPRCSRSRTPVRRRRTRHSEFLSLPFFGDWWANRLSNPLWKDRTRLFTVPTQEESAAGAWSFDRLPYRYQVVIIYYSIMISQDHFDKSNSLDFRLKFRRIRRGIEAEPHNASPEDSADWKNEKCGTKKKRKEKRKVPSIICQISERKVQNEKCHP